VRGGVAILDFGSQYSQLIARTVRELGVYCELFPGNARASTVMRMGPGAVILSGGPSSVYDEGAPMPDPAVLEAGLPVLGVCYGMQLIALSEGGRVEGGHRREFGPSRLVPVPDSPLFAGTPAEGFQAWMSHGDRVVEIPPGYSVCASTGSLPVAAMENRALRRFCVQFHPEVRHTENGRLILSNFLFGIAGLSADWSMSAFRSSCVEGLRSSLGSGTHVVLGLSGGVDSSVVAALLHEAIPSRFTPIFVDTGLLRAGEREAVEATFRGHFGMNLITRDASRLFLDALEGVTDPERKRKIIGAKFIEVFQEAAAPLGATHLAQGTLYPDVIESVSFKGPSATIKSHHNVGGLPDSLHMKLVEPLRELFKDEVRCLGRELGLPPEIIGRHPFPGPGLAVRILGEVVEEDLETLREADAVFIDYLRRNGLYDSIWQAFAVLLPVRTVGVMGDCRTYDRVIALRAVTSTDGMTADWFRMPPEHLAAISAEMVNRVRGVNRVVYDISSKPPSTIEWE